MRERDILVLADDLFVMKDHVAGISLAAKDHTVYVYTTGRAAPFLIDHDTIQEAGEMYESLMCEMATGEMSWEQYRDMEEEETNVVEMVLKRAVKAYEEAHPEVLSNATDRNLSEARTSTIKQIKDLLGALG